MTCSSSWTILTSEDSDRNVHQKCALLHTLQLREQNHPGHPIPMYKVPVLALAGEGGAAES